MDTPFIESSLDESKAVNGYFVLRNIEKWISSEMNDQNITITLPQFDFLAAITRLLRRFDHPSILLLIHLLISSKVITAGVKTIPGSSYLENICTSPGLGIIRYEKILSTIKTLAHELAHS